MIPSSARSILRAGGQRLLGASRAFSALSTEQEQRAAAAAVLLHLDREAVAWTIDGQLEGAIEPDTTEFVVGGLGEEGTGKVMVAVSDDDSDFDERYTISVGGASLTVENITYATAMSPYLEATIDGQECQFEVLSKTPSGFQVAHGGEELKLTVRTEQEDNLSKFMLPRSNIDLSKMLLCPMPGQVVSLAVEVGDEVVEGQELCVVEAMKMQNELKAPKSCVIKSIAASPGDTLAKDEMIMEFA